MRGVWIEIYQQVANEGPTGSLPMRGVWIEMPTAMPPAIIAWSLPMRGVWIEICIGGLWGWCYRVTPHAGSVD